MRSFAFLDLETTGLDPFQHEILEVGIVLEPEGQIVHFSLPITEAAASPKALEVNRYYERRDELKAIEMNGYDGARLLHDSLKDRILVVNNTPFDTSFVAELLHQYGLENPRPWYYRTVDVGPLLAGKYGIPAPWGSGTLMEACGLTVEGLGVDPALLHTAVADALLAKAMYEHVLGPVT